jgi:tetratricopeptide (TPR) repeat protein
LSEAISKYSMVAQTYSARGEPTRAVELLRRVIRLAPMDLKARKRLIDQLLARGKTEDAIKEYIALADVYYNLADLNRARETYLEALRLAQISGVESAFKVPILHQIADIDLQSLDWRQALQIYEQICKFRPDDQKAQAGLVELNFRLGQGHQAMVALEAYITDLQEKGRTEEALAFLENLVAENPGQTSIQQYLAGLYGQMGRVEEAIRHLDSVGERFLKAGDRQGAAQVVESILALEPLHKENYQRLLAKIKGKPSGSLK